MKRKLLLAALAFASVPALAHAQDTSDVSELVVTAPTPSGEGVPARKLGFTVHTVTPEDFQDTGSLTVGETLQRLVPGVNVADVQGNPLTGGLDFRGFVSSPVQGAPQGLAVYLNGQRLNEAFGDTLNWDLIPQVAVGRADVFTNNPAFGLNALGGAVALTMKTGESFEGYGAMLEAGENGFISGAAEAGWNNGQTSVYVGVDGGQDGGWRFNSPTEVLRGFADFGVKVGGGALHFTALGARSELGIVGPTPVDLLEDDYRSVYTFPQSRENEVAAFAVNGDFLLSETWSIQGGLRTRSFNSAGVDGNDAEFERCSSNPANPLFGTLCLEDDAFPAQPRVNFQIIDQNGAPIPCPAPAATGCNTTPYGTIDRTWTDTKTWGGSLQLSSSAPLFGRENRLAIGLDYEDSDIEFLANSTLGIITPELEVTDDTTVPGAGSIIQSTAAIGYGPADFAADSQRTGLYITDTMDLTERLFLTFGGRYNKTDIDTLDRTGLYPSLTQNRSFKRFNPALSLAWRATEAVTIFGGYSETNRAPTPLELGCSDPLQPCLLENSLVADPPLEQVVAKTFEVGVRGAQAALGGTLRWSGSAFSTQNENDIVSLASTLPGRGFFANVEGTRRRGVELEADLVHDRWSAYAGYSFIEAEYDFDGLMASPNNPAADADGFITITKGDSLGGIPRHRFKLGGEVDITDALSLGADAIRTGEQFFVGDEGNDNDKLDAYWVVNARASYRIGDTVELFARVNNLFDEKYATFGTYFDAEGVENVVPSPLPPSPDEATVTPGAPRTFRAGVRIRFR